MLKLLGCGRDDSISKGRNGKDKVGDYLSNRIAEDEAIAKKLASCDTQRFPFTDLQEATKDFKDECVLSKGGFGKVFIGCLKNGEVVVIKKIYRNGGRGTQHFMAEVLTLSAAKHENLLKLIGYCFEGRQQLLVYEHMSNGSLGDFVYASPTKRKQLDWQTRVQIAAGAARGLQHLHESMNPPITHRGLTCSNVLLGSNFETKISDFALATRLPTGGKSVVTELWYTRGYTAPEYRKKGELTLKIDIYSFGILLLELVSGRPTHKQEGTTLVQWAEPLLQHYKNYTQVADVALEERYSKEALYQILGLIKFCISEKPKMRPKIGDLVIALDHLASQRYEAPQRTPLKGLLDWFKNLLIGEEQHAPAYET